MVDYLQFANRKSKKRFVMFKRDIVKAIKKQNIMGLIIVINNLYLRTISPENKRAERTIFPETREKY